MHPSDQAPVRHFDDVLEIIEAEETDTQETHMPADEFLTLLGFSTDIHQVDPGALYKACLNLQGNPAFQALPREKRIAALQTGSTVMTNIHRG